MMYIQGKPRVVCAVSVGIMATQLMLLACVGQVALKEKERGRLLQERSQRQRCGWC